MELLQIIILALIQGLTEFLPISSSAHLILVPLLTDWQDQGLAFDVAVHVGTLAAVLIYFRSEWTAMLVQGLAALKTRRLNDDAKLGWGVVIGTIPVGLVGVTCKPLIEEHLRSPFVIAATTLIFGLLLGWSYAKGKRQRSEYTLSLIDCLLIGCGQALALIPGTSRSGITITAALMLGLTGKAAARFSFLLSIPAILLPGLLLTKDLIESEVAIDWNSLLLGAFLSGIAALVCIHFFLKLLDKIGMMPFVVYRLILGIGLIIAFS